MKVVLILHSLFIKYAESKVRIEEMSVHYNDGLLMYVTCILLRKICSLL